MFQHLHLLKDLQDDHQSWKIYIDNENTSKKILIENFMIIYKKEIQTVIF